MKIMVNFGKASIIRFHHKDLFCSKYKNFRQAHRV